MNIIEIFIGYFGPGQEKLIGGVIGKRTAFFKIIKSRVNEDIISASGSDCFIKRAGSQIVKNRFLHLAGQGAERFQGNFAAVESVD